MKEEDIEYLVVHCSATPPSQNHNVDTIRQMHLNKGWSDIGYHFVITQAGDIQNGRPTDVPGAHANMIKHGGVSYNRISLGICMVGGVDNAMVPVNNYTDAQWRSLESLIEWLKNIHPFAQIVGHRDLSPDKDGDGEIEEGEWVKACPCFDVKEWLILSQQ